MQTKKDYSYGVVPVFQNEDGRLEVLVIHQNSVKGDSFWIFPKGHPEEGESVVETALRELEEETGIPEITLDLLKDFSMDYTFTHEGVHIEKSVTYFMGFTKTKDTAITQPREVAELRWCSFKEARELLSHDNTKRILDEVEEYIQSEK